MCFRRPQNWCIVPGSDLYEADDDGVIGKTGSEDCILSRPNLRDSSTLLVVSIDADLIRDLS